MLAILVAVIIAVGAVFVVRNNRKNAEALLVSMKKKADLNKDGVVNAKDAAVVVDKADLNKDGVVNAKDAAVVVDAVKTTVTTAKKKYGGKVKKTKSL